MPESRCCYNLSSLKTRSPPPHPTPAPLPPPPHPTPVSIILCKPAPGLSGFCRVEAAGPHTLTAKISLPSIPPKAALLDQ